MGMNCCGSCKHGVDSRPGGQKVPAGTVWCSQRCIQMGKNRQMPCYVSVTGKRGGRCVDCRRGKKTSSTGAVPRPENVWCDRKNMEVPKMRTMECFE